MIRKRSKSVWRFPWKFTSNVSSITALRLRSVWIYQELHTQPGALVSWEITGSFQADRIMLERKTGRTLANASI